MKVFPFTGRNICSELEHFKCTSTDNCVLPHWIGDGIDDCADGSDEGSKCCSDIRDNLQGNEKL